MKTACRRCGGPVQVPITSAVEVTDDMVVEEIETIQVPDDSVRPPEQVSESPPVQAQGTPTSKLFKRNLVGGLIFLAALALLTGIGVLQFETTKATGDREEIAKLSAELDAAKAEAGHARAELVKLKAGTDPPTMALGPRLEVAEEVQDVLKAAGFRLAVVYRWRGGFPDGHAVFDTSEGPKRKELPFNKQLDPTESKPAPEEVSGIIVVAIRSGEEATDDGGECVIWVSMLTQKEGGRIISGSKVVGRAPRFNGFMRGGTDRSATVTLTLPGGGNYVLFNFRVVTDPPTNAQRPDR